MQKLLKFIENTQKKGYEFSDQQFPLNVFYNIVYSIFYDNDNQTEYKRMLDNINKAHQNIMQRITQIEDIQWYRTNYDQQYIQNYQKEFLNKGIEKKETRKSSLDQIDQDCDNDEIIQPYYQYFKKDCQQFQYNKILVKNIFPQEGRNFQLLYKIYMEEKISEFRQVQGECQKLKDYVQENFYYYFTNFANSYEENDSFIF